MTQWYVKELSALTHVSVQTLHHYDRINLLKPSIRLANGYRLYSEKDLLKLQQIIALKFFGFELAQIKILLTGDVDVMAHFSAQLESLEKKAASLLEAGKTLKNIISDYSRNKSIPWETVIQLIEVYRMTQQLRNSWVSKVLSPDELKEYANFEQNLKTRFSENEKLAFEEGWAKLVAEVDANLNKDPTSDLGMSIGKRCMNMVNGLYGKEHITLRNAIWEKGFKTGEASNEHAISPECVAWLDKAIDTYYRNRVMSLLNQVEIQSNAVLLKQWNELLNDMYGDNQSLKNEFCKMVIKDDKISKIAKEWIEKISKS